ncbi:hypothetical protein [Pseudomonas sp. F8002]|uniref:hypothetical protein n=1 Tax=Pseudomonas sp. F8002 TaxID=2738822 RepID=UPI0015A2EEFF|nr:hypothetical protein [Pseudomonas sp. F8002]NWB51886.1 hypothetical protein [Pseudomonas sp. F8002]
MLSDKQIDDAIKAAPSTPGESNQPEHRDCIRFAYEWLDAQTKTKGIQKKPFDLKHLIQRWAGRYVSSSDVEVAAHLHPDIRGRYPYFNISSRLTSPSINRISNLGETYTQTKGEDHDLARYSRAE